MCHCSYIFSSSIQMTFFFFCASFSPGIERTHLAYLLTTSSAFNDSCHTLRTFRRHSLIYRPAARLTSRTRRHNDWRSCRAIAWLRDNLEHFAVWMRAAVLQRIRTAPSRWDGDGWTALTIGLGEDDEARTAFDLRFRWSCEGGLNGAYLQACAEEGHNAEGSLHGCLHGGKLEWDEYRLDRI